MTIETEVKIRLADPELVRTQARMLDCLELSPRHFEDNFILDFPDRRLHARASLLRVRFVEQKAWLTYKGAPSPNGPFKTREECETAVEDGPAALTVFERLGMRIWFRYQKYREEYKLTVAEKAVHLALDETPIGPYAEIEGQEEGIRAVAARLGFLESEFLRASYYSLYLEYCTGRGEPPGNMIFPVGRMRA